MSEMDQNAPIHDYVSYLCLVYHEARNVRWLIKAGHREKGRYRLLVGSLPTDRIQAWSLLQPLRQTAVQAEDAGTASRIFEQRFGVSLEDLVDLYEDQHWKHAPMYGGSAWAPVARAVIDLREALDCSDRPRARKLLLSISAMNHNNGQVGEKLHELDAGILLRPI
jgi:hypothetical protein